MNKQLLIDYIPFHIAKLSLVEGKDKPGTRILRGKLQEAGVKNGNGRVYPPDILKKQVENYIQGPIKTKTATGELDHPDSSVIELKNASHIVTHIEMRNDEVIGKLRLLDTPAGRIAKDLIRGGVKLGVSSRGLGSTKEQSGVTMVQDDFQLICFDLVSEPSTTGAFLFKEHKEPNIFTKSDKIYRALNDILIEGE